MDKIGQYPEMSIYRSLTMTRFVQKYPTGTYHNVEMDDKSIRHLRSDGFFSIFRVVGGVSEKESIFSGQFITYYIFRNNNFIIIYSMYIPYGYCGK